MTNPQLRNSIAPLPNVSLFQNALDATDTCVWVWTLGSNEVFLSENFYQRTDIDPDSVSSSKEFLGLFSNSDSELLLAAINNCSPDRKSFECDFLLQSESNTQYVKIGGEAVFKGQEPNQVLGTVQFFDGEKSPVQDYRLIRMPSELDSFLQEDTVLLNQFYEAVVAQANIAVVVKNLKGLVLMANSAFCRIFCPAIRRIDEIQFSNIFEQDLVDNFNSLDVTAASDVRNRAFETEVPGGTVFEFNKNFYCSYHYPISDESGEVIAVGQVVSDVSHQQFTSQQIESVRNEMSLLLDSVRACIWYFDKFGNVSDGNKLAGDIASVDSIRGKNCEAAMIFWEEPKKLQREVLSVIDSGFPIYDSLENIEIEGDARRFRVDKIPTRSTDGTVTGVLLVARDFTSEDNREKALDDSEARYRAFIDTAQDNIWCFELNPGVSTTLPIEEQMRLIQSNAKLVDCNLNFALSCGVDSPQKILGSSLAVIQGIDYEKISIAFIKNNYRLMDYESKKDNEQGNVSWWQVNTMGSVTDNQLVRIWGTSKNVTERVKHLEAMEYQASHDSLTGLPNRVLLYSEIEKALSKQKAKKESICRNMALLLLDLDRFKEINDTLGHQAGDKLLRNISLRLIDEMSDVTGMVARLGGDEFAIFLPSIRNPQQAIVLGHRVIDAISQSFCLDGFYTEISASVGVALFPTQAKDLSALMRYADVAMYKAKKETKGVALYSAEEDPHSPERLAMTVDLRRAIRESQLLLYFQPKIDFQDSSIIGFEVLSRWQHPDLGFVPPGKFIPVAENTGLIHPLTAWVLENSVKQLSAWRKQGLNTCVSVNLSARNLLDDNLVENIQELLSEYDVPAASLELEITESAIMVDPARALQALNEIHALGVGLSIDDFGTGYSSLSYLKKLPVQLLKIDFSFVIDMLQDEQDNIIVKSTIHLAHNLGLKVVAEGVESEEIAAELKEMDCDYAQGYFYGRPMPVDEAVELYNSWSVQPKK